MTVFQKNLWKRRKKYTIPVVSANFKRDSETLDNAPSPKCKRPRFEAPRYNQVVSCYRLAIQEIVGSLSQLRSYLHGLTWISLDDKLPGLSGYTLRSGVLFVPCNNEASLWLSQSAPLWKDTIDYLWPQRSWGNTRDLRSSPRILSVTLQWVWNSLTNRTRFLWLFSWMILGHKKGPTGLYMVASVPEPQCNLIIEEDRESNNGLLRSSE